MRVSNIGNDKRLLLPSFSKLLMLSLPVCIFAYVSTGLSHEKGRKGRILHSRIINPFPQSLLSETFHLFLNVLSKQFSNFHLMIAHCHVQASKNHTSRVLGHVASTLAIMLNTELFH